MRENYVEWYRGMQQDENNRRLTKAKSRLLIRVTRPKCIKRWEKLTVNLIAANDKKKERESDLALKKGEVRVELTSVKLTTKGTSALMQSCRRLA